MGWTLPSRPWGLEEGGKARRMRRPYFPTPFIMTMYGCHHNLYVQSFPPQLTGSVHHCGRFTSKSSSWYAQQCYSVHHHQLHHLNKNAICQHPLQPENIKTMIQLCFTSSSCKNRMNAGQSCCYYAFVYLLLVCVSKTHLPAVLNIYVCNCRFTTRRNLRRTKAKLTARLRTHRSSWDWRSRRNKSAMWVPRTL